MREVGIHRNQIFPFSFFYSVFDRPSVTGRPLNKSHRTVIFGNLAGVISGAGINYDNLIIDILMFKDILDILDEA